MLAYDLVCVLNNMLIIRTGIQHTCGISSLKSICATVVREQQQIMVQSLLQRLV